jgi:hypothetical protein
MTDPTRSTDDLEGRLRTVLADRAAHVDGPAPGLPAAGLHEPAPGPVALADRRRPRRLAAGAVAAAAAVVVLVVAVLGRSSSEGPQQMVALAPPPAIAGLPVGFDPETAGDVMRINTDRDPEVAARRYLRWRLTEPGATPDDVVEGLRFTAGERKGAIVPVTWKRADGTVGGTIIVRIGKHGSDIVASTTPGVDLAKVHMEGNNVVGRVRTTGSDLPGPALVDVLAGGRSFPTADGGGAPAAPAHGYGSAATGDEEFKVDVGEYDPIVSARFVDDGAVRTISELALDAPDLPGPDLSKMTPEETFAYLDQRPPDPRCVAADAAAPPGGQTDAPATRAASSTEPFDLPPASSPQDAVEAFAESLGLAATDITITSPLSSGGVAGAWLGAAPAEHMVWEHDGGFTASEVTTPTACWGAGGGSRRSAADPNSTLHFSRIAGGQAGQLWYRTADGSTWTVPLTAGDVGRGSVTFGGEDQPIEAFAVVVRNAAGDAVLVQRTTL